MLLKIVRLYISHCRQNAFFITGFLFSLFVSGLIIMSFQNQCFSSDLQISIEPNVSVFLSTTLEKDDYEPRINLAGKPQKAQKTPKVLIRPRYYSTELGIKEKLFVGVLSSYRSVTRLGMAMNKTISHYVNKILFFIESPGHEKLNISMPGVVVFTDTRRILEPFHMLKYIADNYHDEYDFYFFVKDTTYVKAGALLSYVNNISVSEDVHTGGGDSTNSVYCSLDAGILLSNSVMRQTASNLDWCVKNVLSESDNNFGKCVLHATSLPCRNEIKGQTFSSYILPRNYLTTYNNLTHRMKDFESAITLYPVLHVKTFYEFDRIFSKVSLAGVKHNIAELRSSIITMSSLAPGGQESVTWPIGNQPSSVPITRFDVLHWEYFDENNIYLQSDFNNKEKLQGATKLDIVVILNATISYVKQIYEGRFQFKKFLRGYRRFDPARGLDYIMDLVWIDTLNAEVTHKRIEVCKPLGKTELVPMPYIMENTRVNMILPVTSGDRQLTKKFMEHYASVCMEKHDKTFLMLVLLYDPIDPNKGAKDDVFLDIKQLALSLSNRYKRDVSRIAWISISIPSSQKDISVLLEFAVADLVVKKFSQDSLILMCEPNMDIRQDYLNRVRMNTILQRQVFSPIPFTEFNPDVTYTFIPSRSRESDINKNYGHYDVHATRHISFYIKDYVTSRKLSESIIPIIRTDRDISTTFLRYQNAYRNASNNFIGSIYSMFISYSNVHILRSVEPSLRLRYVDKSCSGLVLARNVVYDKCRRTIELSLGTRSQLAKVILDYQSLGVSKTNA